MPPDLRISAGCRNVQLPVLQLQWEKASKKKIGFKRREQSLHATQLKRNNIGKIVTQAAKEDHFSSLHSRIRSYHFTATETVICVHTLYFVRYHLVLQSPTFLYSPTGQLLFELKVQPHHPKSSYTHLATRHPDPTPLASCTGQVFTLRCKSMKQINPAFSRFTLQNSSYPQFAQLK